TWRLCLPKNEPNCFKIATAIHKPPPATFSGNAWPRERRSQRNLTSHGGPYESRRFLLSARGTSHLALELIGLHAAKATSSTTRTIPVIHRREYTFHERTSEESN